MTSGNSNDTEMRWSSELELRFPTLGGETDVAILPRDGKPIPRIALTPKMEASIARFSRSLASAVHLLNADEVRTGVADFDAVYEVRARPATRPLVDAALAGRILNWPADAVVPHSMAFWRDPFGFNCNAHLPGPPNLATVAWLASIGADCVARLPTPPG